jgi:hypothetical protein
VSIRVTRTLALDVTGFAPLAVGALSASYGFATAIALLALLYLVDIAALLLLVPERRGTELI